MKRLIGTAIVTILILAGCTDEGSDVSAFCTEFQGGVATTVGTIATSDDVAEPLAFFGQLEANAPEEISDEVTEVAEGLQALNDAFAEFEGGEGLQAIDAVQETADIDLDQIGQSAAAVEDYAIENCEDVEADA